MDAAVVVNQPNNQSTNHLVICLEDVGHIKSGRQQARKQAVAEEWNRSIKIDGFCRSRTLIIEFIFIEQQFVIYFKNEVICTNKQNTEKHKNKVLL